MTDNDTEREKEFWRDLESASWRRDETNDRERERNKDHISVDKHPDAVQNFAVCVVFLPVHPY